ncbi:hypothetical protein IQ07DRAFT_640571 [Pyrenochaeta sp. DS3sAY3a]|nr:hypothetical protein IQ07DRAFT_640571 [Pyrenochaeta sp. DS3sAY3a]
MASQPDIPLDELSQDLLELCKVLVHFVDPNSKVELLESIAEYPIARFLQDEFDFLESLKAFEPCKDISSNSTEHKTFRWIHVPVNNLAWVKVSLPGCIYESTNDKSGVFQHIFKKCNVKPNRELWSRKIRPTLTKKIRTPLHARHMDPSCDGTKELGPQLVLFLPYLNWDTFGNYKSLRAVYECYEKKRDFNKLRKSTPREKLERALFPELKSESSLHPRRTLDQFYYSSLSDITTRDADQTVSKWTGTDKRTNTNSTGQPNGDAALPSNTHRAIVQGGNTAARNVPGSAGSVASQGDTSVGGDDSPDENGGADGDFEVEGRTFAVDDSLLVMVDQLWCWIVDDRTVLSFFPSGTVQYTSTGFRDLYSSISSKASKCRNVFDFYSLVAKKATNYFFNESDRNFTDLVELYRWVVSKKAASQTMCFQEFQRHYTNGNPSANALDDRTELKLVLEISDIIDELNIMQYLFKQQRDVLQSLIRQLQVHYPSTPRPDRVHDLQTVSISVHDHAVVSFDIHRQADNSFEIESTTAIANGIDGIARDHVISTDEKLLSLQAEIAAIISDADEVRNMLLSLLDLKSKTAGLLEARSSTNQGRAVMVFTIVTIIFLPLSFFTSYFGQNVSEITGDPKNPTSWHLWRIATPITIVVVAVAFFMALYIRKPDSRIWGRRRRIEDEER